MKDEQILAEVKKNFTAFLEEKKCRKTPERYKILEAIYHWQGHFDADSLFLHLKKKEYKISRATVYNTLNLLVECNLVSKHQFGQLHTLYEKSLGFRQHDHVVCTSCNRIFEFCDPRVQLIQKTIEQSMPVNVVHHALTFYSHCTKTNCENLTL